MIVEKERIEGWSNGNGSIGHITLDRLAIPETVKVMLLGEQIIPESFDIFGHPNFTEEQEMLFVFKEEEFSRKNGEYTHLEAEIIYEERVFDVPRNTFDTAEGIKKSLTSLSDLNEMINNRRMFRKAHENERLNQFIIFGCFCLDQFGQVMSVQKIDKDNLISNSNVEEYDTFIKNNSKGFSLSSDGYHIPKANSVCPCCGKEITIADIKSNPSVIINEKVYHDSCWRNYRKLTEIDKLTRWLMNMIYKTSDYSFDLLPNGYCHGDCCAHIPWLLFHTIDGDIIIGWRKRVISIEWQKNYKPFDMKELFSKEDVTKWEENGKRGIHAWGNEKAYDYLIKVVNTVNPDYLKD